MPTVIDILEQLESDASRLFKEEVLENNIKNDLLRRVFTLVGDPYVNFYVNKFKMPNALSEAITGDDKVVDSFLNMIVDDLSNRKIVGNAAKTAVNAAFQLMDARQQKWCQRIILKNLRCGVQSTTVNKIWPGSITSFSVQLAESLSTRHEPGKGIIIDDKIEYPVRVEPKLDGLRCVAVKHNGEVTMFTRNGTVLETLPRIKAALEAAPWDDFVLDSEVLGADWNESASVVMSHKKGKDDSNMILHVFDAMHFDDWHSQVSESTMKDRVDLVEELVGQLPKDAPVKQVAGLTVTSEAELMKFYSESMEAGYEGIMLKDLDSPYLFKRSDNIRKMKPVATYEGVVVGHYEGRRGSKREGLWGGFEVVLPNGVVTRLGGGFTDKLKSEVQLAPDDYLGKIVEMEGQPDPLTGDGLTKDGRVRFPVFCRFRDESDVDPKVISAGKKYFAG